MSCLTLLSHQSIFQNMDCIFVSIHEIFSLILFYLVHQFFPKKVSLFSNYDFFDFFYNWHILFYCFHTSHTPNSKTLTYYYQSCAAMWPILFYTVSHF